MTVIGAVLVLAYHHIPSNGQEFTSTMMHLPYKVRRFQIERSTHYAACQPGLSRRRGKDGKKKLSTTNPRSMLQVPVPQFLMTRRPIVFNKYPEFTGWCPAL